MFSINGNDKSVNIKQIRKDIFMEEIIKQLRKEFNRIGDNRQESNIRLHIIENTFMNY